MPKTKTIYSKQKNLLFSDLGNQMLSSLWRLDQSDSEASFIRDAIVFYMNNAMSPKVSEYWSKQDVPEINDFGRSKDYALIKEQQSKTLKYLEECITSGVKFSKNTPQERKKINDIFKKFKK